MVDLFITGSISTNTGTRIAVDVCVETEEVDPIPHLQDVLEAAGHDREAIGDMRINVTLSARPCGYKNANFLSGESKRIPVRNWKQAKEGLPL